MQRAKDSGEAAALHAGLERLTAGGPEGMGHTYKAMVIAHTSLAGGGPMAGFEG